MEATHCPCREEGRHKLTIMRKLAGTTWGTDEQNLKTSYQGTVRPNLQYSSSAKATTAKYNRLSLNKAQIQALRIITGATKSTIKEHQTPSPGT